MGITLSMSHPGYFHVEAKPNPFWQEIGSCGVGRWAYSEFKEIKEVEEIKEIKEVGVGDYFL